MMPRLMRSLPLIFALLLPVLVMSCAGPNELTRRGHESLAAGDPHKAYELAIKALRKNPHHVEARAVLGIAATAIAEDWRTRIFNLASVDTVMAAEQVLELAAFRREVVTWGARVEQDPAFRTTETALRGAAARTLYVQAEEALQGGAPKEAYGLFLASRRYIPGYRDADARAQQAYELATNRVAVLPFVNNTGVRGLSQVTNDRIQAKIGSSSSMRYLEFTELVAPTRIMQAISLAQLGDLPREEAALLGHALGADQVVRGRLFGARVHTETDRYHETIYRRVVETDDAGHKVTRYVEQSFDAILRRRTVSVSWAIEALDTEHASPLAERNGTEEVIAYTAYTAYEAEGDCDDYFLAAGSDAAGRKRAETRWKKTFGSWTLSNFLAHARKNRRSRVAYRPSYRDEFRGGTGGHPVFLDDVPTEDDLIVVALHDVWKPVHAVLQELDRQ
jgi:hypothetical protein